MIWWSKQQLKSKDAKVRQRAVEKIVAEGSAKALPALTEAFKEGDVDVRLAIVAGLGELRDEGATTTLCTALRDSVEPVRAAAAKALARIGGTKTISALVAALKDPATSVR